MRFVGKGDVEAGFRLGGFSARVFISFDVDWDGLIQIVPSTSPLVERVRGSSLLITSFLRLSVWVFPFVGCADVRVYATFS